MLSQKMRFMLFLSIICLGLSACGSGSGDNEVNGLPEPPEDTEAPDVSEWYPMDDREYIEPDEYVRIEFSELIKLDSLIEESDPATGIGIQLFSGIEDDLTDLTDENERDLYMEFSRIPGIEIHPVTGDDVDIEVTVARLQTKMKRFALANSYTVKVYDSVQDEAGNSKKDEDATRLGVLKDITFDIDDGKWQNASLVSTTIPDPDNSTNPPKELSGDVFNPQIASNLDGDIIAVWQQEDGGVTRVLASRYSAEDKTWGDVETSSSSSASASFVDAGSDSSAFAPDIAVNESGVIAVVWYQAAVSGGDTSIWINVFDGNTWMGATNILAGEVSAGSANYPKVVVDDEANIYVAWREISNGSYRVKAAVYDTTAVDPLTNVKTMAETSEYGDADSPEIEISSKGAIYLVWPQQVQGEGMHQQIFVSRYVGGSTGWAAEQRIDIENLGNASAPKIAIDENNDAFAIWQQYDGERENIWINRYSGGFWGVADTLETNNLGDAVEPSIAFSRDNMAFAIWQQDSAGGSELKIQSFSHKNPGWKELEPLGFEASNGFSRPTVKFDREGNAMAMWVAGNSALGSIAASRYLKKDESWTPVPNMNYFSQNSQGMVLEPLLNDGRMLALWYHLNGAKISLASALFSE